MPPPSSHSILHLPLHFHRRRRRPAAMGCAQGKPSQGSPDRSACRGIDRLMHEYAYVPFRLSGPLPAPADRPKETDQHDGRGDPVEEKEQAETEEALQPEPPPPAERRDHELVDGWPRWLLDNVPPEALQGIVPKSADAYDKIDKVGQGTYSNVYKARERGTGRIVALKKVRFDTSESESVKFMAREIRIVQKLDHPHVIKLDGIATSRMHRSIYLVFDFMYSDLARLVCRSDHRLTEPQIKCYMQQLLSGLQHCHERGILHRDIKGSNLLIDRNGVLKIGDFGLANYFGAHRRRPLTSRVVTLWYRAPELLLGSTDYGVGIDLWSAGCLLAEMFFGKPIMPGKTEVEQLFKIFSLCGSPPDDYWRKMKLSASFRPPKAYKSTMLERFRDLPPSCIALLSKLLALDPSARGTAGQALQSKFFSTQPLACDLSSLNVVYKEEVGDPTSSHDGRKPKLRQRSHRKKESKQTTEQSATESRNNDEYPNKEEEIAIDTTPPPPAVQEPETAAIAGASSSTAPKRSSVSPAEALPADQSSPASQEQVPRASSYYSASRRDLTKNYPPLVPPREGPRGGTSAEQAGLEKRSSASMAEFRAAAREKDLSKQYVVVDQM